jgi:hypothetical protein
MGDETVHASTRDDDSARVSFSDVVRAHYAWDGQAGDHAARDAHARDAFEGIVRQFEKDSGEIIEAYWCRKDASGVALTKKRVTTHGPLGIGSHEADEYRLFRVSDWVTSDAGEIPNLLHECDVLAIKAANGLEGIQQAVAMQWLQSVEAHLLGFIERHREVAAAKDETKAFAARQRSELARIEDYYQRAGEKRARITYVTGMLLGGVPAVALVAVAVGLVLLAFGAPGLKTDSMREFYVALAAGAIGAVISVLMRMSKGESFRIDHELGSRGVFQLGAYRPLIGAVSGIALYFLVQTPLLSIDPSARTLQYYAILGFLAGFSERWTQVTLSGAMRTVGGGDPEEPPGRDAGGVKG